MRAGEGLTVEIEWEFEGQKCFERLIEAGVVRTAFFWCWAGGRGEAAGEGLTAEIGREFERDKVFTRLIEAREARTAFSGAGASCRPTRS